MLLRNEGLYISQMKETGFNNSTVFPVQFKITAKLKTQVQDYLLWIRRKGAQVNTVVCTRATGTKYHHVCFTFVEI